MLAERLPGLLPDLGDTEAMEVTAIDSLCSLSSAAVKLLRRRPYENPHHTATSAAIIGGGSGLPRPGAASRAHRGVLF
jgi:magnesium chelatase family protein